MFWTLLLVGVIGYCSWRFLARLSHNDPLDILPGPYKYPIIGNAISFIGVTSEGLFQRMRIYKRLYGDRYLIRIVNRRILHVCHPDDIELVLSHSKNIKKNMPYSFLEPWLGQGLLLSSGADWHKRRKILTPAFHFNILRNFSVVIEEKGRELVKALQSQGDEIEVELMPTISNFTLNTICETAMGTKLEVDKSDAAVQYKNAIQKIGGLLLGRLTRIWLHSNFTFSLTSSGKLFKKYLATVHSFADGVIEKRRSNLKANTEAIAKVALETDDYGGKKRLAMLDLLLVAEKNGEIDVSGIRDEVNTFMFEGHDTTAMALTFGILLLANHEKSQELIYEECHRIFGKSDRTPTMSDLAEMKYTEAVIKETLRLYPSVPFIARKISEDFMMGDLLVKAGNEVAVHIYDVQRREDLFPEPEKFKPERFLDHSISRHPYGYIPFSAGPRNCIGQRFAMQEMKCAFSEIIRAFKLESMSDKMPELIADLVLRPKGSVHVKFIRRY